MNTGIPTTTLRYARCTAVSGDPLTVTPGQYYQILPDPAEGYGRLRVIDNSGEDYLYDAEEFEEISDLARLLTDLTVRLGAPAKAAILQMANRRGVSMSALLREWIDERLDLPSEVY